MTEYQPTHIVSVRTDVWTKDEYVTPGLMAPEQRSYEHYRGTVADCDRIAEAKGILFLVDDFPATEETPIHYRFYLQPTDDDPPAIAELWCSARLIDRDTPWVTSLPLVDDVFPDNDPHAEFLRGLYDASLAISEAMKAGKKRDADKDTGSETPGQARLDGFTPAF